MSDLAHGIIAVENPQQCDYCGQIAELRPYGRNGACICFTCGMKPENKEEVDRNMARLIQQHRGRT